MDIPEENLIYIPEIRKTTIQVMTRMGFEQDGTLLFKDEFGTHIMMVCMKRKYPPRLPFEGEYLICGICANDCKIIDDVWIKYYNQLTQFGKINMYDPLMDRFLDYDGCEDA